MKIKEIPEDFCVEEIADPAFLRVVSGHAGQYAIFVLEKRECNTLDAISKIASILKIRQRDIGYAGNKDKDALTRQYISIKIHDVGRIEKIKINGIKLSFVGFSDRRINLGDLKGNHFVITVRDLDDSYDKIKFNPNKIKNLFGPQRFGVDNKNVDVGRFLIKRDFSKACELLGLTAAGKDYIGALRKVGLKMLRFYVSAYQSCLWNEVAKKINSCKDNKIEIVGFLTEFQDRIIEKLFEQLLKEEGIKIESFLIKEFKEISHEGDLRDLYMKLKNFSYVFDKDELNSGRLKCRMEFDLMKGSYATVLISYIFDRERYLN